MGLKHIPEVALQAGCTYDVLEINKDRVVIGIGRTVTAAVNKKDLIKA